MSTQSANDYLSAKVMTATPQKLHLMLIEGAVRCLRVAAEKWDDETQRAESEKLVVRAIDIVGEMLAAVRDSQHDLAARLEQVYQFVLTQLAYTYANSDRAPLLDALRVLEYERETWQMLCAKLAEDDTTPAPAPPTTTDRHPPLAPDTALPPPTSGEGLSLEA